MKKTLKKRSTKNAGHITPKPEDFKKLKAEPAIEEFKLELSVGGQTYLGISDTMYGAIANLEKPVKIVSRGTLRVRHGEIGRELVLNIPQIKRLYYPLARVMVSKQLSTGLK